MRLVSLILTLSATLLAQSPIGIGPGKAVQSLQLGPSAQVYGDTVYCSGWLASAAALPVTSGLPVVCSGNDSNNNIDLWQLDTLTWGSTVHATLLNSMSSYGGASTTNIPSGWWGYCSQLSLGSPPTSDGGGGCSWKSRGFLARGGCIYLPVSRQITGGTSSDHDATIIKSCDSGATWANPYTVSQAGTPLANGDAPAPCSTTPCTAASPYTGAMMWFFPTNGFSSTGIYNWSFVQYGQDGNLPAGINGGLTDPSLYACAVLNDGTLGCAPNGSIQTASTWRYYAGRITPSNIPDPNNLANWTYLFDARSTTSLTPALGSQTFTIPAGLSGLSTGTRVYVLSMASTASMEGLVTSYSGTSLTINVDAFAGSAAHTDWDITPRTHVFEPGITTAGQVDYTRPNGYLSAPVYMKEFKSYLMSGWFSLVGGTNYTIGFVTAPKLTGPWTTVYIHPTALPYGFPALALGLNYTVVSANPPVVRVSHVANGPSYAWTFSQWEFGLGRQPYGLGENAAYTDIGLKKLNAGWVFGSGETPGTFSRKGLLWAFDFMDHGGDTSARQPYFHDVANNGAVLYPCWTNGGQNICGYPSNGITYNADSVATTTGYYGRFESRIGELSIGGASPANLNAPAQMTGNGAYTVVQVVRIDALPTSTSAVWKTGNGTVSGAEVGLVQRTSTGYLQVWFGNESVCEYAYQGTWAPTIGNWYFLATVMPTQNGTAGSAVGSLWAGVGGSLVDEFAGLHPTQLCGGAVWPPNVTAGPLVLGNDGASGSLKGSYAGTLVYDHALSYWEVQNLYRAMELRMKDRGITLQ